MNARVRFLMSFVLTAVFVGAGALSWGLHTGKLTIFGDSAPTVNADLAVTSAVDLEKGIEAGDHQLKLTPTGLGIKDGFLSGTAILSLGQRDIVTLNRVVPIIPTTPNNQQSVISFAFAGSTDGVSFNVFSPAQAAKTSATSPTGVPIELAFLLPSNSRFVRIRLTLSRTALTDQPSITGFTLNYSQLALLTSGAMDESVLVNGTPANDTIPAHSPGRPTSLVVTGPSGWLMTLVTLWLFGLGFIWTRPSNRLGKGGHGRTTTDG